MVMCARVQTNVRRNDLLLDEAYLQRFFSVGFDSWSASLQLSGSSSFVNPKFFREVGLRFDEGTLMVGGLQARGSVASLLHGERVEGWRYGGASVSRIEGQEGVILAPALFVLECLLQRHVTQLNLVEIITDGGTTLTRGNGLDPYLEGFSSFASSYLADAAASPLGKPVVEEHFFRNVGPPPVFYGEELLTRLLENEQKIIDWYDPLEKTL